MKIYFTDQSLAFDLHLQALQQKDIIPYDPAGLRHQTSTILLNTTKSLSELDLSFLFDYRIFPSDIMTFYTQWQAEKKGMAPGDVIVQQVQIPPWKHFSQKIVFGVRVKQIFNTANTKGFSYETFTGHVEKGISTFLIEQQDGKLNFTITTFSAPGNFLSYILGPLFSIPYQTYCTRRALEHVKKQIESQ